MPDLSARRRDSHSRRAVAATEEALYTLRAVFTLSTTDERDGERTGGAGVEGRLRSAVEAARDAGVAWGDIATVLGIARGNAYQRYRRRPSPSRVIPQRPSPL